MIRTIVEVTTQYRRRKRDVLESEIAPIVGIQLVLSNGRRQVDKPMRGCAISPLIGPANHTKLVKCSLRPRLRRKGVPYLFRGQNGQYSNSMGPMLILPKLHSPCNLSTSHRYRQCNHVQHRQVLFRRRFSISTILSIRNRLHVISLDGAPASVASCSRLSPIWPCDLGGGILRVSGGWEHVGVR